MGRPALGAEKKIIRTVVSSTQKQKDEIEQKANLSGMTAAAFFLEAGLRRKIFPPPPAVNLETLREINAVGRSLNTIIVLLRKGYKFNRTGLEIKIAAVQKQIGEVACQLIGRGAYEEAEQMEKEEAEKENLGAENSDREESENDFSNL